MQNEAKLLVLKTAEQAVEEARQKVSLERSGKQLGLLTRFPNINEAMLKYWRFGQVTMIAGASGSGKSAILNMIEDDFANNIEGGINQNFKSDYLIVACKYEMTAADELLRTISGKMEKSYGYLLSSEMVDTNTKKYNTITDEEFDDVTKRLEVLSKRPIVFIELAGNLYQLYATIAKIREEQPQRKIVITIDHSLLSAKLDEKDDLALMANTAKFAMNAKKILGCMVIFLNQLNGNIEASVRKENPNLHYPQKTDVHCGNQLFWACDDVWIFHRPELLEIDVYGKRKIPTKDLIHGLQVKSRFGTTGNCWFEQEFAKGRINSRTVDYFINKSSSFGIK